MAQGDGKTHDLKLFKDSKIPIDPNIKVMADAGYTGITKEHTNTELPIKKQRQNL